MADGDRRSSKRKIPKCGQDTSNAFKIFCRIKEKDEIVSLKAVFDECAKEGIHLCGDPRFQEVFDILKMVPGKCMGDMMLDYTTFERVLQSNELLVRAMTRSLVIPNFQEFCKILELLYQVYFLDTDGTPARHSKDYCTMSTEDIWGIGLFSSDGQKFLIGETEKLFTLQACVRPFLYALIVNIVGFDVVHSFCGMEPVPYNFMEAMLNDDGKPYNPMNIGGALVCCAIWQTIAFPKTTRAEKFEKFICLLTTFTGGELLQCDNVAVIDEKEKSHTVWGVVHNLKLNKCLPPDTDMDATLEFYFQISCLKVNCEILALMSSTLSNDGINSKTETVAVKSETARHTLSLLRSCGVYNTNQDFCFDVGLPAKFSKSGAGILMVPGFFGIGMYSPFMTEYCKSRRGIKFANIFSRIYHFNPFDHKVPSNKLPPPEGHCGIGCALFNAVEKGEIETVARLVATGTNLATRDYMRRSVLHVAASEGHLHICRFIMTNCPNLLEIKDNMDQTALDDAMFFKQNNVAAFLSQWMAVKRGIKNSDK